MCPRCGELRRPVACSRHPRAVAAQACVVCQIPVCAACRRGTRHAVLCEMHRDVRVTQGWAEVLCAAGELEAELSAGSLRAGGIEAIVISQKDHAYVFTFGGLSIVRVLVPALRLEEARALLH